MNNPYEPMITDEVSGIEVRNNDYYIWQNAYLAGMKDSERGNDR